MLFLKEDYINNIIIVFKYLSYLHSHLSFSIKTVENIVPRQFNISIIKYNNAPGILFFIINSIGKLKNPTPIISLNKKNTVSQNVNESVDKFSMLDANIF